MNPAIDASLEDRDNQVKKTTGEQHGAELGLVENLLTCCLRAFMRLGSFRLGEDNRIGYAQLLLATRGFNSSYCSYGLLQQGYYQQALTLVRSTMEDNLTALDTEKCGGTLDAILKGTGTLGKGEFTYAKMAERQGDRFRETWKYNYGSLSEYAAHARRNSLKTLVAPGTRTLRLGGLYDRALFIATCEALLGAAIGTADVLAKVLGANAAPWQQESWPSLKAAQDWRETVAAKVKAGEDVEAWHRPDHTCSHVDAGKAALKDKGRSLAWQPAHLATRLPMRDNRPEGKHEDQGCTRGFR